MRGKFIHRFVSVVALAVALALAALAWIEFRRGEPVVAGLLCVGLGCALAVAWLTREPYQPRITFRRDLPKRPGKGRRR